MSIGGPPAPAEDSGDVRSSYVKVMVLEVLVLLVLWWLQRGFL